MPTKGDLFVDRPLTIASIQRILRDEVYVAGRVFPNVPVQAIAATYRKWDRGSFLRAQMQKRGDGAETPGARLKVTTGNLYHAEVWGLHKDIGDQARAVSDDSPWNLERATVEFLTQQALLTREREWARNFFTAGKWTTELAGVTSTTPGAGQFTRWDQDTSDPIRVIRRYRRLMLQMTGMLPNTLVLHPAVLDALMEHPDILERGGVGSVGTVQVDSTLLARLFGVQNVYVAMAVENVSAEGAAENIQFIMGQHALLCYAAPNANLELPSAGYTISWRGYKGAGIDGNRIKKFRLERNAADRIEIEMAFDIIQVAPDLGIMFLDAVS
jgi:hypothetical protein